MSVSKNHIQNVKSEYRSKISVHSMKSLKFSLRATPNPLVTYHHTHTHAHHRNQYRDRCIHTCTLTHTHTHIQTHTRISMSRLRLFGQCVIYAQPTLTD